MIIPKCYTCGKCLSNIELKWKNQTSKFKNELNDIDKSFEEKTAITGKILDDLKIMRFCCRTHVISSLDKIKIVK